MTKAQSAKTPEDIYSEAVEGADLSSGDLRLLTSGLMALRSAKERAVNNIELQAISGMVAYVGYTQNVREDVVYEVLASHFGINAVAALPSRLYQDAIEYLVDLKMDNVIN